MNAFDQYWEQIENTPPINLPLTSGTSAAWPQITGEFFVINPEYPIAISTLASEQLAAEIAELAPAGLNIVGKTETENIGVEKIIKNTIINPHLRLLILCGREPDGHHSGATILALLTNGVNAAMRIIGAPGRRPVLANTSMEEIDAFRSQIQVVDLIGCEDLDKITSAVSEAHAKLTATEERSPNRLAFDLQRTEVVQAQGPAPEQVKLDKAGYFVILPDARRNRITVEHYSYDNRLLRIIEGQDARSVYWTIIENNWVTELSHAAYLGKELAKAELSLTRGFKYVQDGA